MLSENTGTIDPTKVYTTKALARIWGRKDIRKLEEQLRRAEVPILRLGSGLATVDAEDIKAAIRRLRQ